MPLLQGLTTNNLKGYTMTDFAHNPTATTVVLHKHVDDVHAVNMFINQNPNITILNLIDYKGRQKLSYRTTIKQPYFSH